MNQSLLFSLINGSLHGINPRTGNIVWETALSFGYGQVIAYQNRVYVAMQVGTLFVIDAVTGALITQSPFPGSGQAPTLFQVEDQLFVTAGGELTSFDLDGRQLWTNPFRGKGNRDISLATFGASHQGTLND